MLLLYYTPVVMVIMYRGVFTVGVAVTEVMYNTHGVISSSALISANALADYSYINARDGRGLQRRIARCLTGLGPTSTSRNANGDVGGLYFNGTMIPNGDESARCNDIVGVILVRLGAGAAGVINIEQCRVFTTDNEGVYTCAMMNSEMMNQSVRFGIYLNGRSESLDFCMS